MITSNLTGNFGNHLSQYSICRMLAELKGFEYGFNPPTHDDYGGKNQLYFMDINWGKEKVEGIEHTFEEKWTTHDHYDTVNITVMDKRVYNIGDNTRLIGFNGAAGGIYQSEGYYIERKPDMLKWFAINKDHAAIYERQMRERDIILDDNTCVINFRGSHHYRGQPNVLCRREYWRDAVNHMLDINHDMKFICITDDPVWAENFMPVSMPVFHIDIGFDFYVVNKAKWLIISNSSFGWWGAWLNTGAYKIIAPKYWARHNVSNGYWAIGDQYTSGFSYLDRDGNLDDYDTCKKEALHFYKIHNLLPELFVL